MHKMQTIVTDVRGVCLSVCLSRWVIRCSPCQITVAYCYGALQVVTMWYHCYYYRKSIWMERQIIWVVISWSEKVVAYIDKDKH